MTSPSCFADTLRELGYSDIEGDTFDVKARIRGIDIKVYTVPDLAGHVAPRIVPPNYRPFVRPPDWGSQFRYANSRPLAPFPRPGATTMPPSQDMPADEVKRHLRLLAAAANDPRLAPTLAGIPWLVPAMEMLLKARETP